MVLKVQTGEAVEDSLAQLYDQNMGLINRIITRYKGLEDPEDLRQEAFFGIVKAAEMWSPDGGGTFATYCFYWVQQALYKYLSEAGSGPRVPVNRRGQVMKYNRVISDHRKLFGRDPTAKEAAAALGVSPDQLEGIKKSAEVLNLRSLDDPVGEDLTRGELITDPRDPFEEVLEEVQREELRSVLWPLVEELPERESHVLRGRYKEGRELRAIGDDLGISAERVRQIENEALKKMRRSKVRRQLEPYVEEIADRSMSFSSLGSFRRTQTSGPEWAVMKLEKGARRPSGGHRRPRRDQDD